MDTFGKVLTRHNELGPGFDFLRITLAIAVVTFHAMQYTGNPWLQTTPAWMIEYSVVPMFFALSGFLVTASGLRLSLRNFLLNRGLRIVPALAVEIFVSALVIGPAVTTLNLKDYFTTTEFWTYFLNIFGYIHFNLPGVFQDHVLTFVNGALWTVPYEILCYVITSFLIYFRMINDPKKVLVLTLGFLAIGVFFQFSGLLPHLSLFAAKVVKFVFIKRESQLLTAFLFGMLAYQLRRYIPHSAALALGAAALCVAAAFVFDASETLKPTTRIVLLPALTYVTVYLGLTTIKLPAFLTKGDYSYGLYLYHNPLLQIVIGIFPGICLINFYGGVFTVLVTLPFAFMLAVVSWHFIEKPILSLRKKFSFTARIREIDESAPSWSEDLAPMTLRKAA